VADPVLSDDARGIHVAPIRHHSPACAFHLAALIEELAPAAILVEGPCDFDPLIPSLVDPGTRPPVAIVSIADRDGGRSISTFPFCAHSPEYVALAQARARGVPARFIDLPAGDKAMLRDGREDAPPPPVDEQAFDTNDYVRALAERLGCRDGNEVWDHLFEARIGRGDWRAFFADVGRYCGHMRACTSTAAMAADGTLAREEQMIAHLAAARREVEGPILAVVGGFHAPALAGADLAAARRPERVSGGTHYLVRYGYRQLNLLSGYAAGLPFPSYYAALWEAVLAGRAAPFAALAHDLLSGFVAHLREALPGAEPPVPVLVAALENAQRLADLRGRPGPLRDDLIDACRSTLLKGEESGDASPVMAELAAYLTGTVIGDVPPSAGSPPLVEAVRGRARSLGFRIDDGERRARELDIYRNPRHRAASRFLHATRFIGAGFAERTGGPDFRSGVDLDRLFEHWSVMWSPLVEARLIECAAEGDTLEAAVAAELTRRLRALEAAGQGADAVAAIDLFAAAAQAGIADAAGPVLPLIETAVTRDADLAGVTEALRDLVALWRGRAAVGLDDAGPLERLIVTAWRRALFLLPGLAQAREERIAATLEAMATLREVVELAGDTLPSVDVELFDEAVERLLDAPLDAALAGAVAALSLLAGRIDEASFAGRLGGELRGAHADPARRIAWLRGVIAISRELLWRVPALVGATDAVLAGLDDDGFVELLPHLRLAFARLDPREIDRLAQAVGERHRVETQALVAVHDVAARELDDNLRADRAVAAMLATDGLA
jgi:Family of unknown function (DUF5682)